MITDKWPEMAVLGLKTEEEYGGWAKEPKFGSLLLLGERRFEFWME